FRHDRLVHHQILAASAAQTDSVPRVVDRVLIAWHEEGAHVGRFALVDRRRHAAEHGPLAEVAPAGERPAAAQAKAAGDALAGPGGREGRRKLDTGVFSPDVSLPPRREEREVPVVHADHAENPGARPADRAELHDGAIQRRWIELVAAVALGLETAKEP